MSSEWLHDPSGLADLAPPGFTMGVATSAFQVEGAIRDDAREPSTWDAFMAQPGRIADGSTAAVTADHYHRLPEDLRLLRELGIDSYGFSLGWSRLQPNGRGAANRTAVAFYDRLLDGLLAAGIRPLVTLYHWDTPEQLQHTGGWLNRDTAYRLADFAFLAGEAFGDRVDSWITVTEPATVTLNGYAIGTHAPGATLRLDALPAAHHQLLGHGLAVEALRAADVSGAIGLANVHSPVEPASDRAADTLHAALFDMIHNRLYADPVLLGRYPEPPEELAEILTAFDEIESSDLRTISQPIDFYGLSYSAPTRIRAGAASGSGVAARSGGSTASGTNAGAWRQLPFSFAPWPDLERTGSGAPNAPEHLAIAMRQLGERYGEALPRLLLTGIGASYPDSVAPDRSVDDPSRVAYLADHLAVAFEGAPGVTVSGCFVSSFLDGWEWEAGFTQRFGLVHVDFETQARTPKLSYRWMQSVLGAR